MTQAQYEKIKSLKENIQRVKTIIGYLKSRETVSIGIFGDVMGNVQFMGQDIYPSEVEELDKLYYQKFLDLTKEFEEL